MHTRASGGAGRWTVELANLSRLQEDGPQAHDAQSVRGMIEDVYQRAYGAAIREHYPDICFRADADGRVVAAAGIRRASDGPLFLESYLDAPIEDVIQGCTDEAVTRGEIVEIGNLVSNQTGQCRSFFSLLCMELHDLGYRYAVATATRPLRRIFQFAGFESRFLAIADPARLPDFGAGWGTYYATDPHVVFGSVTDFRNSLESRNLKRIA
jgi:hypothetical protein